MTGAIVVYRCSACRRQRGYHEVPAGDSWSFDSELGNCEHCMQLGAFVEIIAPRQYEELEGNRRMAVAALLGTLDAAIAR